MPRKPAAVRLTASTVWHAGRAGRSIPIASDIANVRKPQTAQHSVVLRDLRHLLIVGNAPSRTGQCSRDRGSPSP